jgi:hypothetical protein
LSSSADPSEKPLIKVAVSPLIKGWLEETRNPPPAAAGKFGRDLKNKTHRRAAGSRASQLFVPLQTQAAREAFAAYGNSWWLAELASPSSSGGENDVRYAYFPQKQRLAILQNGKVTVYDTLHHNIQGVLQQQQQDNAFGVLTFSSQFGTFSVDTLPTAGSGLNKPTVETASPPRSSQEAPSARAAHGRSAGQASGAQHSIP